MRLGPGSVLQHCHLRVRPGVRVGRSGPGRPAPGAGPLGAGRPAPGRTWAPLSTQTLSSPRQGPIHVGTGCFVSGLDVAQSQALHGVELRDLILRGHHVQLHGAPSRAFTLVGRLDSWEVGAQRPPLTPIFRPWAAPVSPAQCPLPCGALQALTWGIQAVRKMRPVGPQQAFPSLLLSGWGLLPPFFRLRPRFREGSDPPWLQSQLRWVRLGASILLRVPGPRAGTWRHQGLLLVQDLLARVPPSLFLPRLAPAPVPWPCFP